MTRKVDYYNEHQDKQEEPYEITITLHGPESAKQLQRECQEALNIIDLTRESRMEEAKQVYMSAVLKGNAEQVGSFEEFIKRPPVKLMRDDKVRNFVHTVTIHGLNAYSVKRKILLKLMGTAKFMQRYPDATIEIKDEARRALILFSDKLIYNQFEKQYLEQIRELCY